MRLVLISATLIVCAFSIGCDPVRRVQQTAVLQVTSLDSAVPGYADVLSVSIRECHQPSKRDEELERFSPGRTEDMYPWTPSVETDALGLARVTYGVTALDRSKGNTPPTRRYPLEGRLFRVRIQEKDGKVDELLLLMRQGETAKGLRHQVVVERVSNAVYVNPD